MTTEQLHDLGADDDRILRWVGAGRLHRRHETVFSVGHRAWTPKAQRLAAVLAAGHGAALSHIAAAVHRDLLRWTLTDVDVMVPRNGERDRDGIRFHRPCVFGAQDVETVDGIRCTTVARTLVDLAGVVRPAQLERAVQRAEYLDVLEVKEVVAVLDRIARPRGVRALRRILGDERIRGCRAESDLERDYAALIEGRVEPPRQQHRFRLGPDWLARADFYWPRHGLVVEVDGPHHALPTFAAADARRDARLAEMGLRVHRFTEVDLRDSPADVLARTRALTSSKDD